jgi:hypothetical protein
MEVVLVQQMTQVWSAVAASQTAGTQLITVGIGPEN